MSEAFLRQGLLDTPRGICHPDDEEALKKGCPEYDWATDPHCPLGFGYDQDTHRIVARVARGRW